ncbi:MAG: tetratricopeptide repeat protein [Pyrinomonadaceae bacterium]
MFRGKKLRAAISLLAILSLNLNYATVDARATDLVPSDDVTGGTSVFVFRDSRKKPQTRAGGGKSNSSAANAKLRRAQIAAQLAAERRKKAAAADARRAELARIRARERNARLKLSNTLTARAEAAMEKGDSTAAINSYREALKANSKNTDAANGLSQALTIKGIETAGDNLNETAIVFFDEAVFLDPKNAEAFAKLGEIHAGAGRNDKAIANYEKALAVNAEFNALYMPLGMAYLQAGNTAMADGYLAKAAAAGVDTSDAKFARVQFLAEQKPNDALAELDRIIRAQPQNADAHFQRAGIYDRTNQRAKAIESYKEAVRGNPEMTLAWFNLGVAYYNQEEYENSRVAYLECIKHDPNNAEAHANLASVYRQLNRFEEANVEYKIAHDKGMTKDADFYSEWGFCTGKTNEWDKAVRWTEEARVISPTAIDDTNVGWAYYNAAQADKAAKNDAAAKTNLEKSKASLQSAVQKDPKLDAAYVNLGSTHNSLGEYDAAIVALNTAIGLHNDWVIALNQLGLAYRGQNNLPMALQVLNRAVSLDTNNVVSLFTLGSTQFAAGDKKAARKTQDRLKKINPVLADRLGGIIAGKAINEAERQIRNRIRIPRFPY